MGREKRRAEPPGAGSFKTAKGKTDGENSGKSRDQTLLTRIRTLPAKCLRSSRRESWQYKRKNISLPVGNWEYRVEGIRFMIKKCSVWMFSLVIIFLVGCGGRKYEKIEGISEDKITQENKTGQESGKENNTKEAVSQIVISEDMIPDNAVSDNQEAEGDADTPADDKEDPLTLLFSGDVLLSDHVLNAYEKAGGIHGVLDEEYRKQIREADFFLVNQEFPFSDRGTAANDKQYTFRLPTDKISLFREMEIDGVTLANNHALDFGQEALLDSCEVLDEAGILHTGAGSDLEMARQPVRVELKGKRIAIIGATRVIPVADWAAGKAHPGMLAAYDMTVLLEEISRQKQENDFVVVCIHWGIEREERPEEYQRTMGRQMIDAGADLVVGSHPHVLQGIEYYEGKPIVYSLGNFVFGSSIPRTALLQAVLEEETLVLRLIPGTSGAGYTRMLTEDGKRREFFQHMESISYGVSFEKDGTVAASGE